jgi:hypothetical protein
MKGIPWMDFPMAKRFRPSDGQTGSYSGTGVGFSETGPPRNNPTDTCASYGNQTDATSRISHRLRRRVSRERSHFRRFHPLPILALLA